MEEKEIREAQEAPEQMPEEQEAQHYVPAPRWQVWGARILLVVFLVFLAIYYYLIARGGR